ncbi:hypothetical protein [Streptomyces albipurpureus]|uniref:Uncharacterized protein n=1 Tax=Streptomyces albipurpureus TaxID=2897419 RepID=A0ABT0UH63_9ACTN|nr:hypothetical protein [Streptomyces sp. CWNU-1]MCM2387557.1 hypothetical protein [Streptomyces sp. CWNU-1]
MTIHYPTGPRNFGAQLVGGRRHRARRTVITPLRSAHSARDIRKSRTSDGQTPSAE